MVFLVQNQTFEVHLCIMYLGGKEEIDATTFFEKNSFFNNY
jgi:hypothetical protein